jgi:predicted RNase H-like nuclease (RuvC/YqgF family)
MPPKGPKDFVATAAGTSATRNPTIAKPPRSRPDATAAVLEATARLAAARAAAAAARDTLTPPPPPPPSNQSSHRSITPEESEMEVLQAKVASMENRNEAILNMLEEVKKKFEALETRL